MQPCTLEALKRKKKKKKMRLASLVLLYIVLHHRSYNDETVASSCLNVATALIYQFM